ncbi:MAG TPA: tetratricopeptide repeat protein [Defluviitoga tunisiensis]|jgi:tetratricopeptide (TPR) repeat protein|nr:tetratricopeptide repeat protein [Defluviitoga tunisiensis]
MKNIITLCAILLIVTCAQAQNYEVAYDYYFNGLKYYRNGNYEMAQFSFQKALELSPELESEIPEVKMYLGLSAFQNKDYSTARIYLDNFRGNIYVDQILEIIETIDMEKDKSDVSIVKTPINHEQVDSIVDTSEESSSFSLFITVGIIVFSVTCLTAILTFYWLRKYNKPFVPNKKGQTVTVDLTEEPTEIHPVDLKIKTLDEFEEETVQKILSGSKYLLELLNIKLDSEIPIDNSTTTKQEEMKGISDVDRLQKEIEETLKGVLTTSEVKDIEGLLLDLNKEKNIDVDTKLIEMERENAPKIEQDYRSVKGYIKPDQETSRKYNMIINTKEKQLPLKKYTFQEVTSIKDNLKKSQIKQDDKNLEEFFTLLFNETNYEKLKNQNIDF